MFACMQMITRTAKPPLFDRRRPAQPALIRVNPPGGAPFFRLEVYCRKGRNGTPEIPWKAVEQAAGRLRTRVLLPEGVAPPPPPVAQSAARAQLEPGVRAFVPKRLPLLLCLRAAQEALQALPIPARERRVTVVDSGVLCNAIEPLVPLAGSLRVCTPDVNTYRKTAQTLLHRYGVTLILSDSVGSFAQSHVVIANDLHLFTGREQGLIFTPDTTPLSGCKVVRCRAPQLPEPYAGLCPPGIDPLLFASALYELCGVKEMERMRFGHYAFDGATRELGLRDVCGCLLDIRR